MANFREWRGEGKNNRTPVFWERILIPAAVVLAFWRVFERFFDVFLVKKLRGAQKCNKKSIFPLYRGPGAKLRF